MQIAEAPSTITITARLVPYTVILDLVDDRAQGVLLLGLSTMSLVPMKLSHGKKDGIADDSIGYDDIAVIL